MNCSKTKLAAHILKFVAWAEDRKIAEFARMLINGTEPKLGPRVVTIEEALHIFYMGPGFSQRYWKRLQKQTKGKLTLPKYSTLKAYEHEHILVDLDPIYKENTTGINDIIDYWESFNQNHV